MRNGGYANVGYLKHTLVSTRHNQSLWCIWIPSFKNERRIRSLSRKTALKIFDIELWLQGHSSESLDQQMNEEFGFRAVDRFFCM